VLLSIPTAKPLLLFQNRGSDDKKIDDDAKAVSFNANLIWK
jgi:hypothetical protein